MRLRLIELGLWLGGAGALASAGWISGRERRLYAGDGAVTLPRVAEVRAAPSIASVQQAAAGIADADMFHSPPQGEEAVVSTPPPVRVRPPLVLSGILGVRGAWTAVLGGVPGREQPVFVVQGDTIAGLVVRVVTRDSVVVAAPDSTWTIRVRNTWLP